MKSTMFIKPAIEGAVVRDPITKKQLAEEGEEKPRDRFWTRRLNAGDVVEVEAPAPAVHGTPIKGQG